MSTYGVNDYGSGTYGDPGRIESASASLSGEATLTGAGYRARHSSAGLTAESSLTAAARRTRAASAALSGDLTMTAAAKLRQFGAAALTGESVLAGVGYRARFSSASLLGESALTGIASPEVPAVFGSASLSGELTLSAAAIVIARGRVSLSGSATLVLTTTEEAAVEARAAVSQPPIEPAGGYPRSPNPNWGQIIGEPALVEADDGSLGLTEEDLPVWLRANCLDPEVYYQDLDPSAT